ncbi:MAG TPA: PCYCGC motif-containing (lipo)protein [Candidatus Methanoperedens sp.]
MKPEKKTMKAKIEKSSKKKGNSTLIIAAAAVVFLALIAWVVMSGSPENKEVKKTMTLKEVRAQIDAEYGKKGMGTDTAPVRDDYVPILAPRKADKLPDYVLTNAMTLAAYKYATEHPEVLEQIPCYCGCGQHGSEASEGRPHRFLRDCFINDKGEYDNHASFCDVCIGEALKAQKALPDGIPKAAAAVQGTTAPVQVTTAPQPDLSSLSLAPNFKSLSDGLKLIPPGISWAYFTNLKQGVGIEQDFTSTRDFYGVSVIGMLNSEYTDGAWIELHDVGKNNAIVKSNAKEGVDNILDTRPYIFDTRDKTSSVLALMNDTSNNANAYNTFKNLLEKTDDENAGFAKINTSAPDFANASYIGLVKSGTEVKGEIAFSIKNDAAIPMARYNDLKNSGTTRGFKSYEVIKEDNILVIRMTSTLDNIINEATRNYEIEI